MTEQPTPQELPPMGAAEAPPTPANDAGPATDPQKLAEEIAGLKDRLLRALAETENVRRRAEREREETAKFAVGNFAKEMVTVADNLRRALDSAPAEAREGNEALKALAEGVEMTERSLLTAFERFGLKRITPQGEKFDPNRHQAIAQVEADQPAGTVVDVMQSGYVIHDRLLRPAMVTVAKGKTGSEATAAQFGIDLKA